MIKIDLHAHSSLQPWGQTFCKNPSKDDIQKTNIWYFNPPKGFKEIIEEITGISPYSQANFTSAALGDVRVVSVAIYAPEISFFDNSLPSEIDDPLEDLITRYGEDRIKQIVSGHFDYFVDCIGQLDFMERFDTSFSTNNNYRCVIAKGYNDIKNAVNESSTHTIVGVMNIEGAHALGCGYHKKDGSCDPLTAVQENTIRANVITLKTRNTPILYLTFCHHFYNQLCGHCKSLPGIVADIADQTYGENFPLTDFGEEVITMLLDPSKGRSIYIDIKHMSYLGRLRYFQMIKENNWNVPIIYSHGGANGFTNRDAIVQNNTKLNPADLSLYDNEILAIAHSNGFFGLNIDQRVMSSKSFLNEIKKERIFESKEKRQYIWSSILFENIKYIAELFERNAINPWDYMCLGTDFDGAIHPINFFLQESDLPLLASCLQQHIVDYYTNPHCPISQDHRLSPELVINKIMYGNAQAFLEKWF